MKTKIEDYLNENNRIYLRPELEPETNPIFWKDNGIFSVNLGNLVNALKNSYGYKLDNFQEQEANISQVVMGREFIMKEFPKLGELLLAGGTEQTVSFKATSIPNQYEFYK